MEEAIQVASDYIRCPFSLIVNGNIKITLTCQFLSVKLTKLLKNDGIQAEKGSGTSTLFFADEICGCFSSSSRLWADGEWLAWQSREKVIERDSKHKVIKSLAAFTWALRRPCWRDLYFGEISIVERPWEYMEKERDVCLVLSCLDMQIIPAVVPDTHIHKNKASPTLNSTQIGDSWVTVIDWCFF